MCELGGDLVRLFSFDETSLTPFTELAPLETDSGAGPRHGVFWTSPLDDQLYFIFVGELAQKVYSYQIEYTDSGMTWTKVSEVFALGEEKPALQHPPSGIELSVSPSSIPHPHKLPK